MNYDSTVEQLSFAVSIVLILTYVAGLVFSLKTHRGLFNPQHSDAGAREDRAAAPAGNEAPAREPAPAVPANPGPERAGEEQASPGPSAGPWARSRSPAWPWA